MKKFLAFILIVLLLLCPGCTGPGNADLPQEPENTASPEASGTGSSDPSETTSPASLPWEQDNTAPLGYDAYFDIVRCYYASNITTAPEWIYHYTARGAYDETVYLTSHFSVWLEDGTLSVLDEDSNVVYAAPCSLDGQVRLVAADDSWVYGVRDDVELFRMDYYGGQYETLFCDGAHTIGDGVILTNNGAPTLFFSANAEGGSTIYRLFLPDLTLDLLAETAASAATVQTVFTNHAVIWSEGTCTRYANTWTGEDVIVEPLDGGGERATYAGDSSRYLSLYLATASTDFHEYYIAPAGTEDWILLEQTGERCGVTDDDSPHGHAYGVTRLVADCSAGDADSWRLKGVQTTTEGEIMEDVPNIFWEDIHLIDGTLMLKRMWSEEEGAYLTFQEMEFCPDCPVSWGYLQEAE